MDDFDMERELEDAGIDAFEFSLMDEDERRQTLEDAFLDPDMYMDADLDSAFDAWEQLQSSGLSLSDLDSMDDDERRAAIASVGLDPSDYDSISGYPAPSLPTRFSSSSAFQSDTIPEHDNGSKGFSESRQPSEPMASYRYLQVRFFPGSPLYAYRTGDCSIKAGDQVVVPVGHGNNPMLVTVVSVGDYAEDIVPYPLEKTKSVLRKATEEDIAALNKTQPSGPVREPTEPKAVPAEPLSATAPVLEKEELLALRQKNRLLRLTGILLAIIVIMAAGILIAVIGKENKPAPESINVSESAAFSTQTPALFPTTAPQKTESADTSLQRISLSNTQTDLRITEWLDRLDEVSAYLGEYNEAMWLPDEVSIGYDEIIAYENAWARYAADMAELRMEMDRYNPSAVYTDAWNDLYGFVDAVQRMAEILSDWDENDDGEYSDRECSIANNLALTPALEAQKCLNQMSDNYDIAVQAVNRTATPTPRPVSTPRRTTSTPKPTTNSDPFNARDYSHPDDFYYDYYDDFWDYEDAEDYWEEWND